MAVCIQSAPFVALAGVRYISLSTFRRSGAAVATPVWFAQVGATLYAYSDATAGKVKRIRNNPRVRFAACTVRGAITGPFFEGEARIVTDPGEISTAEAAIIKKYGLTRRLYRLAGRILRLLRRRRPQPDTAYLAITASEEPLADR